MTDVCVGEVVFGSGSEYMDVTSLSSPYNLDVMQSTSIVIRKVKSQLGETSAQRLYPAQRVLISCTILYLHCVYEFGGGGRCYFPSEC